MGDKRVRKEKMEGDRLHKGRWVTKEHTRKRWRAIDCTRKDG